MLQNIFSTLDNNLILIWVLKYCQFGFINSHSLIVYHVLFWVFLKHPKNLKFRNNSDCKLSIHKNDKVLFRSCHLFLHFSSTIRLNDREPVHNIYNLSKLSLNDGVLWLDKIMICHGYEPISIIWAIIIKKIL